MQTWRLLETGHKKAAWNMALDQAILESVVAQKAPPTLRLYGWDPHAVSIGYFQSLEDEVDLARCNEAGVDVVRRITGGGAVFHQSEVTYSVSTRLDSPIMPSNVLESYKVILAGLIKGLEWLGIEASFAPLNDVIAAGKKISGSAQTRRGGGLLQHGTLLMNLDVDLMFSLLKVPEEKMRDKLIATAKERVTSVYHLLGGGIGFNDAAQALQRGFSTALGVTLESAEPTEWELERAIQIRKERFESADWTKMR